MVGGKDGAQRVSKGKYQKSKGVKRKGRGVSEDVAGKRAPGKRLRVECNEQDAINSIK